ncbi:MAG: anthranilate phosphoribosyltransferase [Deltaproteobacteria bacterium]|nr:MAG: anthranilate phosphoribosyltransferase [Deltaproteobacteria bacterium]
MIKEAIAKVIEKVDLSEDEMEGTMNEIMSGEATPAQIGSLITALRMKGETVEEITGAARLMRKKAVGIRSSSQSMVDTCGTGGDQSHTFNISTASAFVVAGTGLKVAKHGNRSVSSQCGSADVLESLGVNIEAKKEVVEKCLEEIDIAFLFAPLLHGAMKYAIGPRREMGIRTIFNVLGPLTNPAQAKAQVIGVYDGKLTETLAQVLGRLGSKHAFVVHGTDGLDEITLTGETIVSELKDGKVTTYHIKPEDFGLKNCERDALLGGDKKNNAKIIQEILKGAKGPQRDIVLLNSAAAIVAGGKAKDLREGIEQAKVSIDSGAAWEKLNKLAEMSNS